MMKRIILLFIACFTLSVAHSQNVYWNPQANYEFQMVRPLQALIVPFRDTATRMPYTNRDSLGALIHGYDHRLYERGPFGWRGVAFTNDTYNADRTWMGTNNNSFYLRGTSGTDFATDPSVAELRVRGTTINFNVITQNTGLSNLWVLAATGTIINGTAPFSVTSYGGSGQSRIQVTPDSIRFAGPFINIQGKARYTSGFPGIGKVLTDTSGQGDWAWVTPAAGGLTSVGLSMPSIFSVSGSPLTSNGTITTTLATQSVNTVFAGPSTGGSAAPTFRTLVAADIPSLPNTKITYTGSTGTLLRGDGSAGNAVAGNFQTSGGRITATNTSSDQLRAAYDGSNYLAIMVNSTGSATLSLTGTSPTFTFSQQGNFSSGIRYDVGSDAKWDLHYRDSATGKMLRLPPGTYGQSLFTSFGGKPIWSSDISPRHITGNSSAPTVSIGSDFTGTTSVVGNDIAGTVTVTITSSTSYPTLAAYFQLNFNASYASTPTVVITPANSSTALLSGIYLKLPSTTSFQVASAGSGTSPGSATYVWNYHVIQ